MKTTYFILLLLSISQFLQAQIVHIPDPNFKAALLAEQVFVNTNGDNEIQLSEAQACPVLVMQNNNINDITGIEEFINLRNAVFFNNNITTADFTGLNKLVSIKLQNNQLTSITLPLADTALIELYLQNNQLTKVTLPNKLGDLQYLNLSYNQLDSIDLSNVTPTTRYNKVHHNQLTHITLPTNHRINLLDCSHNLLTNIDFPRPPGGLDCSYNLFDSLWIPAQSRVVRCHNNPLLVFINEPGDTDTLICHHSNLSTFNIAINSDIRYLDFSHNNVDSFIAHSDAINYLNVSHNQLTRLITGISDHNNNFSLNATNNPNLHCIETTSSLTNAYNSWTLDSQTSVSADCQGIWSTTTLNHLPNISLYPNPTSSNQVQLDLGQWYEQVAMVVYNSLGQEIQHLELENTASTTLTLPSNAGFYLVKIQTPKAQAVLKVVKE